jgi:putative transposase
MISPVQREQVMGLVEEAVQAGARRGRACAIAGVHVRTVQRWKLPGEVAVRQDQRPLAARPVPANKLSAEERQQVLTVCNQPAYASLPPSQIVPKLADRGTYLASESTFYRILRGENQLQHRGRAQARRASRAPQTHIARAPNAVWTWDISYLPSTVIGQFYYLYLVEDLYSRYGVAWEVHEAESGELAAELLEKALWRERLQGNAPVLHSDNGSPMKSLTLRAKLDALGVTTSFSRPRVSDDNAYVEAFFRTLKYGPTWPTQGFASLEQARAWVQQFMHWYNHQHQHSQIRFVTPAQRHRGEDTAILAQRAAVYAAAKAKRPDRWSGNVRNWTPVTAVALNPDKNTREWLKNSA